MTYKYYAENNETKEVYECNYEKLVADTSSHFKINRDSAIRMLERASIDDPIKLWDCIVWMEE